jgi:hypothetical protein
LRTSGTDAQADRPLTTATNLGGAELHLSEGGINVNRRPSPSRASHIQAPHPAGSEATQGIKKTEGVSAEPTSAWGKAWVSAPKLAWYLSAGAPAVLANETPLTIVLDTNVWLKNAMLRDSAGAALRFYLRQFGARVAVPEVVRSEVVIHLGQDLKETAARIRADYRQLLKHVGRLHELVLPDDGVLEGTAEAAFEKCGIELLDVPFSVDSARHSFEKCLKGEPPSGPKNQQFKDGVLWADCIRLADEAPVLLVTEDKGFYEGREYAKGPAANLLREVEATKHGITVTHELAAVLERVRRDIPIDYDLLAANFLPTVQAGVDRLLDHNGFVLGARLGGSHKLFATDNPTEVHLEFTLTYRAVHPDGREGALNLRGDGKYAPQTTAFEGLQGRSEELVFQDVEGERISKNVTLAVGTAFLGHRIVHHEVRTPLD